MLRRIAQCFSLVKHLQFGYGRKPRPSEAPTQSQKLLPFSINHLHDNPGARYSPKKLGRGPASGKGKTCGRGMKGHKSRSGGGAHIRFEGGQTPLQKRLPKYGRVKQVRPKQFLTYLNLEKIDYYVKLGVLKPAERITIKTLVDLGVVRDVRFGVKVLARGADRITYPLNLEVTDASRTAIDYIQKQGGSVSLVFRTPLKLKEHIHPEKYPLPLAEPIAPYWRVKKLERVEQARGIPIAYTKPKWIAEEEEKSRLNEGKKKKVQQSNPFVFPVPIVENSGKIRKRKAQVYRKINYNLP